MDHRNRPTKGMAVCIFLWAALLLPSCSDDPAGGEPVVITGISPAGASAGDTVTVSGSGFGSDPTGLVVAFSATDFTKSVASRISFPLSASGGGLKTLVPEGAYTGGVRVESAIPFAGAGITDMGVPRIPSNHLPLSIRLDEGAVGKLFFGSPYCTLPVDTEEQDEQYVMILFDSSVPPERTMTTYYSVSAAGPCALNGPAELEEVDKTASGAGGHASYPLDRKKREEITDLLRSSGGRESGGPGEPPPVRGTLAAPQSVEFDVFSNYGGSTTDPEDFSRVTAELKYESEHTLLYLDAATDHSCITDSEAEALGLTFETQIYPIDTGAFGSESDINGDGKVAILLTPVVNMLTPPGGASSGYIAGFFMPGDLLPRYVPAGATNGMEIYYSIVPDPNGVYGNVYDKPRALEVMEGVMAHEFQHMIMFNHRVLILGGGYSPEYMAELWVDEGLSHMAEDLNGYDLSNIGRADLFLADPGNVTLIHGGDDLEERGASFLFFRYLADRFGEGIFRGIVHSKRTGTGNIEYRTGTPFMELFADWSTALYFESLGVEPADPKYAYTSLDLSSDFHPLRVRAGLFCSGPITGDVRSMGPEFISLDFGAPAGFDFTTTSDTRGRMNAVLVRAR